MTSTHAPVVTPARESFASTRHATLGVVSFLNTVPLIDGLETVDGLELRHSVPSLLIDQLLAGEVDVALCSSIDYQRAEPLVVLPVGLLGCDGATLTVCLYSTKPIERIERVYCDTDSHTSVVLMQILLAERYGIRPALVDYDAREHVAHNRPIDWPETVLLIGDKVVTDSPPAVRYPHQLDLGDAWKQHTSLPFVFAAWLARASTESARLETVAAVLDRQRRLNAMRLDGIVHDHAPKHRWPVDLAKRYLQEYIEYAFTPRHAEALETFYGKAQEHGLIERRRELVMIGAR